MRRVECIQNFRPMDQVGEADHADIGEPKKHDRAKGFSDNTASKLLKDEKADEDDHYDHDDRIVGNVGINRAESFNGRGNADSRSNKTIRDKGTAPDHRGVNDPTRFVPPN